MSQKSCKIVHVMRYFLQHLRAHLTIAKETFMTSNHFRNSDREGRRCRPIITSKDRYFYFFSRISSIRENSSQNTEHKTPAKYKALGQKILLIQNSKFSIIGLYNTYSKTAYNLNNNYVLWRSKERMRSVESSCYFRCYDDASKHSIICFRSTDHYGWCQNTFYVHCHVAFSPWPSSVLYEGALHAKQSSVINIASFGLNTSSVVARFSTFQSLSFCRTEQVNCKNKLGNSRKYKIFIMKTFCSQFQCSFSLVFQFKFLKTISIYIYFYFLLSIEILFFTSYWRVPT